MCADRFCAILVAIYSLLESAGSVILGLLAILMTECILRPEVPDPSSVTDIGGYFVLNFFRQYFYTQVKCNPMNYTEFPEYDQSIVTNPSQTQGWLIGYLIDNSLLFLSSLCFLCGIIARKKWLINIYISALSSVIFYDIVLVIVYGLDISVATDPSKTNSSFFNPEVNPAIPITIEIIDTGTTLLVNTIFMMVYFSRFVVFFILNVVCYFVARAVRARMAKPKAMVAPAHDAHESIPDQHSLYPQQPQLNSQYHRPLQRQQYYPPSNTYPPPISQGVATQINPVYQEPVRPPHLAYNDLPPSSYYNPALVHDEDTRRRYNGPEPLERNMRPIKEEYTDVKALKQEDSLMTLPPPYEIPAADYDTATSKSDLRNRNRNSGLSDADSVGSNPTSPTRLSSSEIPRTRPRRTSNSSVSSDTVAPELKGQLPWSYLRPEQLPTGGSKGLREFYLNKQKKEAGNVKLDAPQESDEESYTKSDTAAYPYNRY